MNRFIYLTKAVIRAIKTGTFFAKIRNKLVIFNRKNYIKGIETNPKKIVFYTFQGRYECNAKYIVEYVLREKIDLELVWIAKEKAYKDMSQFPKELKVVRGASKECYKELASAKVIIVNGIDLMNLKYIPKKDQYIIQTWHGSMGFKRIDTYTQPDWTKKAINLGKMTDYIVTNSKFEEDVFKNTFWKDTKMLKIGHPRNDIVMRKNNTELNKKIREKYKINKEDKILLYAPTFRDSLSVNVYNIDYIRLKETIEKKFGGKWTILVRLHFKLMTEVNKIDKIKEVVNVTEYPDMQELLAIADIGITDYSSWMCDFVLSRKPGFLYAPDFEEYRGGRGFYYPLETTPFRISKNNDELVKSIENFNEKEYQKGVDKFLKDRGCYEKGTASKQLIDKINELIKEEK